MLHTVRRGAPPAPALQAVKQWTAERFALPGDTVIVVAEMQCAAPGCPPLETVVVFWLGAQRHQFKIFKPLREVAPGDLPYAWQRESLAVEDGAGFDCC